MNGNSSGNGGRNEIQNLKNGLNKLIGVLQDTGDDIINDAKQSKSTSSHTTETTTTSSSSTGKTIHNKVETTYVTKVATQGTFNFDTSNAEKNIDKLETKVDNINTALDKLKTTLSKLSSIKSGGNFDISGLLKNLDSLSNTSNNSKVYGLIRNAVGNDKSDFNNNAVFGRLKGSLTKLKVDADTKVSEIIQYVNGINGFIEKLDSNIKKTDTQKIDINKTPKVNELTRGTKNVTVDDIIKTFGAVDVTISKAVKKAQKQQEALNKLYDNLLQLSTKTGIESSKIGQGLTFNLTKLNGGHGGQSTKKKISLDAVHGWDDTTASHEIAHSLLSNLAKRLHGVNEFKRLGSMDAVNSLFDDKVFNRIKNNKGVSQTDINIAEIVRNIVAKAIDKKQGNLFQKIDDNAKPDTDKDYYKRNSEIFARLFARGITGKAHESKFELDKTTFNKLIAPQLTKLVEQMYGPDAQKRIRITGSNSQTNNVINIARKNLQQKIEEREKNEGELHNSLSNARDSFASKVKSAVSESNSFEQNAKGVFNSSLKHFEESFKSAINNIAEIFKNQISNPIKEITVSFGTIVTALRQSGIITNNVTANTTNSLKNTVKRVVNTEYEKKASGDVDDEYEYTPKDYVGRALKTLIFPKSNNKNKTAGQYTTIATVPTGITEDTTEQIKAAKISVGGQTNWFKHIRTARRMEQEAIDANMFGWIESGTTQKSYTEDLNKQFNDLNRLYEIYKRLGSNQGMSTISAAIESFKNEKMTIGKTDYSLFKNGKIDLTPSLVKDSNNKNKYYVEGIDADFVNDIKKKYQVIIDKAFTNIADINNTRYANAQLKEGSDSTNDAILRMLRLNKLIDSLNSQLNEEKYKTSGLGLLQKYSTDDIGLISSIRNDYNRIQSGVLMGDYDTNAKQFQTDFALMKTDVDSVIKRIKELFAVQRELVNERQDNRENAFNAAKVAMASKLDSARRFKDYGSGIDENTVLSTGETVKSYYDSINEKIENFEKINPNSKPRDVLYEDIRKAQLEINQLIQDMKDYVKEYKDTIKQDYRDDVTSYKREKSLGDLLSDVQNLDRVSRVGDTNSSVFENYYKSFNGINKRDVFDTEYARISQKLSTGGYASDLEFTKDIDGLKSILEELKTVSKAWTEYENRELKAEENFQKNLSKLVETSEKRVDDEQKKLVKDSYKSEVTSYNREKTLSGLLQDARNLDAISKIEDTTKTNFYNYYKSISAQDKRVAFDTEYASISQKLSTGGYASDLEFTKDIDGLKSILEELKVVAKIWSERENAELKAEEQFNKNIDNLLNTAEKRVDNEQKEIAKDNYKSAIDEIKSEQNLFAYQKKENDSFKSAQDKLYKQIDDQMMNLNKWYFSDETNQMFGSAGYSNIMDEYQNLSSRIGSDEFRTDRTAIEHAINDLKVAIDEFKKSVTSDKTIATNSIENQINWEREQNNINSNLEQIRNNAVTRLTADMNGFVRSLGTNVILRSGALTERGDVEYGNGITARYNPFNGQGIPAFLNDIITDVGNIDLTQGAQHLNNEIQRLTIAFKALIDQTNQNINNEIKRDTFNTQQNNQRTQQNERDLRQLNTDFSRIDKLNTMAMDFDTYLGTNTISGGNIVNYGQIADRLGLNIQEILDMITYIQTGVAGDRFTGLQGSIDYNEYVGFLKNAIDEFESAITAALRDEQVNKHDEQKLIRASKTLRDIDSFYNTFSRSLSNDTGVLRDGNTQTRADIYNWINPMGTGYVTALRQNLIDRFNNGEFDNNQIALADAIQEFKDELAMANKQINNAIAGIRQQNRQTQQQAIENTNRNINTDSLDTEMRKLIEFYGGHFNVGNQQYQNMNVIGNIQGYTDISQAYQNLRNRIQNGEFNDNQRGFTQAINEFKETVRQFRQGSEILIRDFQNNIRQQEARARNLMTTGTRRANQIDNNILRVQRNSTLNTLFGDYSDPFMRGNVRIRLTDDEQNRLDSYRQRANTLRTSLRRRRGETVDAYNTRAERINNRLQLNEIDYNNLRDEIANRTGRQTGRTFNEFQEVYNPAMQSFMQRTGLNLFKMPNERSVDWETLSRGFTSGNRGAFTLELSKFINFPSLRQGIMNYLRDLQSIVTSWFHMMEHAFGRISKIVLTAAGAITGLTAGISATIVAFGAFGKSVVSTTDEFRRNTLALTGVYRTPEKAHEMLQMAYATSANMPMDYSAAMTTLNEISAIPSVQHLLRSPDTKISSSMMEKMFKVITAMTTMRPDKTASDAVFSLRNAFAGDLRSLQRRFDLPVNSIANVKNSIGLGKVNNDPMAMLDSLNNYFDSFLDMEVISQVSRTIGVITEKIKGAFDLFKANIGNSGLYDLVLNDVDKIKNIFIDFVDSDYGKQIAKRLSDALANTYESIKGIARKIGKSILGAFGFDNKNLDIANVVTKLAEGFAKALRYVENVINSIDIEGYLKKAIDYISNIDLSNVIDRISMIATQVGHVARETYDAIVDTVTTLNNARRRLGITDETLARGLIAVWLFGGGNMIQFVSSQLHIIVSAVQIALGTIGTAINLATAVYMTRGTAFSAFIIRSATNIYTAILGFGRSIYNTFLNLLGVFLMQTRRLLTWLFGFIRRQLVPLFAIVGEIYLIGNNFEVIGETAANVIDSIITGFSKMFAYITSGIEKIGVWFSKEFESTLSFLEYVAEELDAIFDVGAAIGESLFDENGIQDYINTIKTAFTEIMSALANETAYYLGIAVDSVMLPLFNGLSKIGFISKKTYESQVSDANKEKTRVRKVADDIWSGLGDKLINLSPKRLVTKINDNRERTTNAWNKWQSDRKKTDKQLYAERQVLYDKIDVDLENTYKELDNRLAKKIEDNKKLYNPEGKEWNWTPNGDTFFGMKYDWLHEELGIPDNDATLGQMLKYALGYVDEEQPANQEQTDTKTTNEIVTVSKTIGSIFNWLKEKAEPAIKAVTPFYKMFKPDSVATDYSKAINKETHKLNTTLNSQKSQYATGFDFDTNSVFGDSKESSDNIYFGPVRLEAMLKELNNSVRSVDEYTEKYNKAIRDNVNEKEMTDIKKSLEDNHKAVSDYRIAIVNMINKSTEMIEDSVAQMDFTYVTKNIDKYVNAQSRTFDKKITSEVYKSIVQNHSRYFATNGSIGQALTEQINLSHGNIRKFVADYNSGKTTITTNSIEEQNIIREFVEKLGYYLNTLTPIINEQNRIKGTQANIGNMRLGELNSNWGRYINDRNKAVRTTAGERYIALMNEGIESDTMGSMVRKVRDIAINSFTDMKTAVINAVQETVKSTQQTIKNGLDKMVMEGGSFKKSFKEIGDTIKKNYAGIYTNEIANNVTKFLYGYSENEQKDPVVTLNTNVVEFKDDVLQKMDTLNDSINNIDIMRSIQRRNDIPAVSIVETDNGLIKGSVQHHEKLGSTLESLNSKYADFNTISNGVATRRATDIGKDSNKYDDFIKEASNLYGIETSLIKAVINTESSFNMLKANNVGAVGLMQVRSGAASDVNRKFGTHYDINNPKDNIMLGTAYLRMQLDKFGNQNLALAAYNAGAGRVIDAKGIPNIKETQNYIPTVNMFKDVFAEREKSNEESQQITSLDSNVSDIRNDIKQIVTGTSANVSRTGYSEINAPTINNIISGTSEGFNLNGLFGGINIPSGIADLGNRAGFGVIGNAISKASGLSVLKSLFSTGSKSNSSKLLNLVFNKDKGYFDSATLTSSGSNILNTAINAAGANFGGVGGVFDVAQMMNLAGADLQEPQTPLKGIWGDLFGTVENVESKFGGAAVGSMLGNMMAGKGLVDSLGAVALKTFGEGTEGAKMIAGANTLTKSVTGLTSTLFGKSAGQSVAKFLGKNFLGTTVGTALPIIGTVASVLSKKGWFGGAKDRTAEGRARGAEFNALRDSLVANRNTMARNYYMANDDTVDALKNYQFGGVAMWTSRRGHKWKGTKRTIMNTDATAFTNSMQGYWDLLQKATEEANTNQRKLDKLANTNNLEALRQTGSKESTRLASIAEDLAKYEAAVSRYAGHDTGFTQTLFDGQSYTMTQLNDKVQDLIKELGDSKNAIAQNTEAIRQEKLATADAKLDYETALYGKYNPLISYQNEIQKLNNEWNSVMNDDGTIGYKENTKEWFNWSTRMLQATDNLEEATKQLEESAKQFKYDVANNWVNTLTQIRKSAGTYSASQVKNIANAYRKKVAVDSVGNNLESVMAGLNPSEMSYTEDVFKTQTTYGKQNVTKWDILSPNVKRVLSDLKRTGRASGSGLRGQEVQQINSLLKSSNGNLSGLIDNLQNEVVGTRSVAIGTKQVKIGERTYTGTSPIKEGAYTNIVNMIKDYNKATGSNIRWQDYFDTKGTYATLYDKSSGTFDESTFTKDIQKSLKTTEGKNALIGLGITQDTSFKALSDKYNAALKANPTKSINGYYTYNQIKEMQKKGADVRFGGYSNYSGKYYAYGSIADTATKTKNINAANTEYLNALKAAGYGTTAGSLTQKDGMYLFNAGGDTGNYQLFKFTKEQASQFVQTIYGKTIEDYMKYSSKQVKVDNYSLKKNVSLDKLFKLVENGIIKYSELLGKDLEHQIAMAKFENVVGDIKNSLTATMTHTTKTSMDTIKENLESIKIVNQNSKDFLNTGDYEGYDDFMEQVIQPLVQNIGGEMQNIANVYEQLFNSGFMDKSSGKNPLTHMTDFMNKLQDAQYAYIVALESGSTTDIKNAEKELNKLLTANSSYFKNLSTDLASAQKLLYQSNAKNSVLGSISGYEDYTVANSALKEFNATLGKNAMNKLLGSQNGMTEFTDANMSKWFGVSGEDPYETYYEWQKKTILQRIKNEKEGSEEWYAAELDLWNLMNENAKYLKDKAEKTSQTIEEMLGRIEETAKMRVAEEAKSQKGDIIFFDLGASRDGTKFINSMLKAIKSNDPEAQKLIAEFRKKKLGA